jgi:hypothetical protein
VDPARAKSMTGELQGQFVGGWEVKEAIGHGKSALVFKAQKADQLAAIKVFDRELSGDGQTIPVRDGVKVGHL